MNSHRSTLLLEGRDTFGDGGWLAELFEDALNVRQAIKTEDKGQISLKLGHCGES